MTSKLNITAAYNFGSAGRGGAGLLDRNVLLINFMAGGTGNGF